MEGCVMDGGSGDQIPNSRPGLVAGCDGFGCSGGSVLWQSGAACSSPSHAPGREGWCVLRESLM